MPVVTNTDELTGQSWKDSSPREAMDYVASLRHKQLRALEQGGPEGSRILGEVERDLKNFDEHNPGWFADMESLANVGGDPRVANRAKPLTNAGFRELAVSQGLKPDVYTDPGFPEYWQKQGVSSPLSGLLSAQERGKALVGDDAAKTALARAELAKGPEGRANQAAEAYDAVSAVAGSVFSGVPDPDKGQGGTATEEFNRRVRNQEVLLKTELASTWAAPIDAQHFATKFRNVIGPQDTPEAAASRMVTLNKKIADVEKVLPGFMRFSAEAVADTPAGNEAWRSRPDEQIQRLAGVYGQISSLNLAADALEKGGMASVAMREMNSAMSDMLRQSVGMRSVSGSTVGQAIGMQRTPQELMAYSQQAMILADTRSSTSEKINAVMSMASLSGDTARAGEMARIVHSMAATEFNARGIDSTAIASMLETQRASPKLAVLSEHLKPVTTRLASIRAGMEKAQASGGAYELDAVTGSKVYSETQSAASPVGRQQAFAYLDKLQAGQAGERTVPATKWQEMRSDPAARTALDAFEQKIAAAVDSGEEYLDLGGQRLSRRELIQLDTRPMNRDTRTFAQTGIDVLQAGSSGAVAGGLTAGPVGAVVGAAVTPLATEAARNGDRLTDAIGAWWSGDKTLAEQSVGLSQNYLASRVYLEGGEVKLRPQPVRDTTVATVFVPAKAGTKDAPEALVLSRNSAGFIGKDERHAIALSMLLNGESQQAIDEMIAEYDRAASVATPSKLQEAYRIQQALQEVAKKQAAAAATVVYSPSGRPTLGYSENPKQQPTVKK